MKALAVVVVVALAACGPGLAGEEPAAPKQEGTSAMEAASGNAKAIRALLAHEVTVAGLWFEDPACTVKFPVPGIVHEASFDALAHCLAELHWHRSMRRDPLADVVVLTYPPGIEIEARVAPELAGPRLAWIGFVSRRDAAASLPSVEPEVFDALRTAGDRDGPLTADEIKTLDLDPDTHQAYAWFQVCLDTTGTVTSTHLRMTSSEGAATAFAEAAARWKFQPFTVHGHALPVCSLVRMVYPPGVRDDDRDLPLPLPPSSEAVAADLDEAVVMPPRAVEARRVAGNRIIEPDATTRTYLHVHGITRIRGVFRLCLDRTGTPEAVDLLQSTGVATYDRELARGIASWRYSPFTLDGKPHPVCTGITFIYSQN